MGLPGRAVIICVFLWISILATSQESPFPDLRVIKRPNEQSGTALVTIKGKNKVLAHRALQAWTIMDGQNALVLILADKKATGRQFRLRFYEGTSRKYRDLGVVPLSSAELIQGKQSDGGWAFALSGTLKGKPTIVIAGLNGVHGLLEGAHSPKIDGDSMTYEGADGQIHTAAMKALIASDMTDIYEVKSEAEAKYRYLQFLRDGTAVMVDKQGQTTRGEWRTDGTNMLVRASDGSQSHWPRTDLVAVGGIPAGTRLVVRLLQPLASEKTKEGDPVDAVLISPGTIHDTILIPQGALFSGTVTDVRKLGWGFRRETAGLTVVFTTVHLPDGTTLSINTRLSAVENARETVNDQGMIKGIRSTGTPAYAAERKIASISTIDPIAYLFTSVTAFAVLGFADPEIRYPAGTEALVQFVSPAITDKTYPRTVAEFPGTEEEQNQLRQLIRNLPFRTMTKGSNKPSDITNLVFIGSADGLQRAFSAAGWVNVAGLNASSTFLTVKTVGGNHVYNEAPMSTLLLDEQPPIFTLSKTTNTFAARHHLRVFDPDIKYQGATVLTSSSTQDIRVAFSYKQRTFIHVIDEYIDNERSKVVNDLEFTGCVEAFNLVPRPWVPKDAYNATGDRLMTDGAVAVMRISDCKDPRTTSDLAATGSKKVKKSTRNTFLYLRDDLYRGNLVYSGISGAFWLKNYFAKKDELEPVTGAWRTTDQAGTQFKGIGSVPPERQRLTKNISDVQAADEALRQQAQALEALHRWDPPHYEIGLLGGYTLFPQLRNEALVLLAQNSEDPNDVFAAILADEFDSGWVAGITTTLNTWKWFSNQFTYTYTRGKFAYVQALSEPANETIFGHSGLITRQFEYNLLFNLRPPKSRWRPYAAVGPGLQLTHLSDSPVKKAAGPFKLGLQNVGLLLAAYDFGSAAPLNGGGIFSPAVVYGGGLKVRVHPRITWSVDFRESLSRAPNFLSDSYTRNYFKDQGFNLGVFQFQTDSKYRQQRFTMGLAFTF
jgi:hypothetical protein